MRRPEYAIPFADLFRELTPAETRELSDSIKANGVMVAVNVYTSAKHGPSILDGANRWTISGELGVPCPVNDLGAMSDQDARTLAEQLNHCRRHLTPADWRDMAAKRAERVKRVAEKRKEGKSLRTIAGEEGVDVSVIHKDLKKATESGVDLSTGEVQNDEVTGKDGKTYKATKPIRATDEPVSQPEPGRSAQTAQPDTDEDDVTVIGDDLPETVASEYDPILPQREPPPPTGTPALPGLDDYQTSVSQVVKEVVATRPRWDAVLRKVREVVEEMDTLATGPSGDHLRNLADRDGVKLWQSKVIRKRNVAQRMTVFEPLLHLLRMIRHSRPAKVCDGCRGHGCRECRHAGFIPYGPLPKIDKPGSLFTIDLDPWED